MYQQVLVGVDFREIGEQEEELLTTDAEEAVARGLLEAEASGAKLTFVHVFPASARMRAHIEDAGDSAGTILAAVRQALLNLVKRAERRRITAEARSLFGVPSEAMAELVATESFDLVVVGTRQQRGLRRALFGSTASRVMMTCRCPVMIAQHQPRRRFDRVLIASDGSEFGTQIIRQGLIQAHINGSRQVEVCHAVVNWFEGRWHRAGLARAAIEREHAEEKQAAEAQLQQQIDALVAELGVARPQLVVATGSPAEVIYQRAQTLGAELVVMGLVGRGGLQRFWFGNTAERVLPELHCSLLTLRPSDPVVVAP
ncbi:MAG: universal stress protein [Planctomycetes bacterium]|nr:universal stress protein [Planctomycetota bacterium]